MIAFRRYQICPEFDVWKKRYGENTKEPNIDPAFLRPPYSFPNEMIHPPFGRVYGNILGIRTSQFQPSKRPRQTPRINPPLKIHLDKLILGITPSLLNRFLRFQRRCNLLIQTFPTMYDTSRFSEEISKEEQVNKNTESSGSRPPEQVLKRK